MMEVLQNNVYRALDTVLKLINLMKVNQLRKFKGIKNNHILNKLMLINI